MTLTSIDKSTTALATGSGADSLVLSMSEDAYQGDAQFTVTVDGVATGGTFTTTALHSVGVSQSFTLLGNWGSGAHAIGVSFINDAYGGTAATDRNLYIDQVSYDGRTATGGAAELASNGTATFAAAAAPITSTPTPTPASATSTTVPVAVISGSGADSLVLSMSEDAYQGDAQFTVTVDGVANGGTFTTTALHSVGVSQSFTLLGNWGSGAHAIGVSFINDAFGGTAATDRNLYIDQVSYDGRTATGGAAELASNGTATFATAAAPITSTPTPTPASAASTTVPVAVISGSGADSLVLSMSEDAYQGDAQFTVTVDGVANGGTFTTTALHSVGVSQSFTLLGNWGSGAHAIGVSFINDAFGGTAATDRNLYIDRVSFDGRTATGGAAELASNGTATFAAAATPITSTPTAAPTPTPTPAPASTTALAPVISGSSADSLVLSMSEDAYQGDAQFTVTVDGVATDGTFTTTALHSAGVSQSFTLLGNWGSGAHAIGISFINDAYGGTAATDRNLYIDQVSYDGRTATGAAAELASNGTATFAAAAAPLTSTPTPTAAPPVVRNGFYVGPGGSDAADGSSAHPFATLQRAALAMEGSSTKTTYVAGGTYFLSSTLHLGTADNGESFVGTAGQTPIITGNLQTLVSLDGASSVTLQGLTFSGSSATSTYNGQGQLNLNGASGNSIIANHFVGAGGDAILVEEGANSNTISGNEIDNVADSGIELKDASDANLIDSNRINGTAALNTTGGGIFGHGIHNTVITHNLVENTVGMGIGILDFGGGTQNSGNLIQNNALTNNDTGSVDSGAIYLLDRSDTDTSTIINQNSIREPNSNAANHTIGIYLDDYTSGVTITNNLVSGSLSDDLQIHGGNNDTFSNNIFDVGTGATSVALIQPAPSDVPGGPLGSFNNDTIKGNLIVSAAAGSPYYDYLDTPYASVAVNNNDYTDQGNRSVAPDTSSKSASQTFVDAAAGNYNLASGTGAASIGFKQIDQSSIGLAPFAAHFYA